jgi:hypothetical protein
MVVEIHHARLKGTGKHRFVAFFSHYFYFNKSFLISKLGETFRSNGVWL